MPSYIGRPADLAKSGAVIHMQLAVPKGIANEIAWEKKPVAAPLDVVALIDTGSTVTVIKEGLAARLGLAPIGKTTSNTLTSQEYPCLVYHVRLLFPQGSIVDVRAAEFPMPNDTVDCLIGCDVLKYSLLIYNGMTNTFSLIF